MDSRVSMVFFPFCPELENCFVHYVHYVHFVQLEKTFYPLDKTCPIGHRYLESRWMKFETVGKSCPPSLNGQKYQVFPTAMSLL